MNDFDPGKHYFQLKGKRAEEAIHELAFKSFLREWCYPNPKRDDGKEICDLLVCFADTLIIVQVKDIKFTGKDERYIRKAFEEPADQIMGAERTLLSSGRIIQLTNPHGFCHTLDPSSVKSVFRIVMSVGDGDILFNGMPTIGGKTIHTFDRSVATVLNELDTIADFCKYLGDKEQLFARQAQFSLMAEREVDLLGDYVFHGKSFDHLQHLNMVYYQEGIWEEVSAKPAFLAKKEADRVSYFWDHLIEFAHECPGNEYRDIARELSQFNRFERRCLSETFMEAHSRAELRNLDFRRTWEMNGITFVFIFTPQDRTRTQRIAQLRDVCTVARHKFRSNPKVIGVATEIGQSIPHSYDFVLMDFPEWSDENQKLAEELQREHSILIDPTLRPITFNEYPSSQKDSDKIPPAVASQSMQKKPSKIGRNDPCPCGSGRKYKKCHGAN